MNEPGEEADPREAPSPARGVRPGEPIRTPSAVFHQHFDFPPGMRLYGTPPTFMAPGVTHKAIASAFRRPEALIVSYPRAGRTWVRAMLAHAFEHAQRVWSAHPMDTTGWTRVEPELPRLVLTHGKKDPRSCTPEDLPQDVAWAEKHRVLLLVRDPRDLMVSLWHERTHRLPRMSRRPPEARTLAEMLHDERGGLRTIVAYYNRWARRREAAQDLLLVRYEHLIEDAALECGRMLGWIGLETSPEMITDAVRATSFETLQRMERSGRLGYRPTAGVLGEPDALIVRRGVPGGYKDRFEQADLDYARGVMAGLDPWFGYSV